MGLFTYALRLLDKISVASVLSKMKMLPFNTLAEAQSVVSLSMKYYNNLKNYTI